MTGILRTALSGIFVLILVTVTASTVVAGPIELLPGRWTGWGKMTLDGGETERVKCVATYFSERGGKGLRHNLRCASTNFQIDAVARLSLASGRVSGNWNERKYATGGAVNGRVVGDGINVRIVGDAFKASLKVETTKCKQTMDISPSGIGVSKIAVRLAKC